MTTSHFKTQTGVNNTEAQKIPWCQKELRKSIWWIWLVIMQICHRYIGLLKYYCRLDHNRRIYLQFINHAKSSDNFQIDCYHNYFGRFKTGGNWKFEYLITRASPQSMHVYKKMEVTPCIKQKESWGHHLMLTHCFLSVLNCYQLPTWDDARCCEWISH